MLRNAILGGLVRGTLLVLAASGSALGSSHREAPLVSKDPFADNTDTFAFVSPQDPNNVVLVATFIPFEHPSGGPNYFEWDDRVSYRINVSNDGDADAEFIYELQSQTSIVNPNTFLYNVGPIAADGTNWNRQQRYTVTEIGPGGSIVVVSDVPAPPVNIGSKSTPDYAALSAASVQTVTVGGDAIRVFAGQVDDPFWVDLQVFDLLTLRGQSPPIGYATGENTPTDSLAGFNAHALVLEIPISRLTQGGETVLGVWATTRRPPDALSPAVQVSRLGMPLVNEAVIPLALKDAFNGLTPSDDLGVYGILGGLLQRAVEDPELGRLLCSLYGVPLPGDTDDDCSTELTVGTPRSGRGDVFDVFLQGLVLANEFTIQTATGPMTLPAGFNVNRPAGVVPAEMLRLNTAIKGDLCAPTPSRLGVLGGDACGFPNGRRLADDVVEIELLAVAGAAYGVLDGRDGAFAFDSALIGVLTDGVDANDEAFRTAFPYLALPHSGQDFRSTANPTPCPPCPPDPPCPTGPKPLQCYSASGRFSRTTASVEDRLGGAKTKKLRKAALLCTEARVNDLGEATAARLLCFGSRDQKGQAKFARTDVSGSTPFGDVSVRVKKPVQTCVPLTAAAQ
jgi:hypothetical protein